MIDCIKVLLHFLLLLQTLKQGPLITGKHLRAFYPLVLIFTVLVSKFRSRLFKLLKLAEKTLPELMEPIDHRKAIVEDFLKEVKPGITYNVVTITDGFGPTIHDPDMDLIVLSQETRKGGEMINTEREKKVGLRCQSALLDFKTFIRGL